ncbi:MFS transporter [Aquibacillus sp. 3ASR75-11]|uniref:MFS transporter n=1 Tax=Terrihalobacillus insolitus TaxID=2950438 RepID=A0A9X4AKX7_9BACI|nr:MFS transporter [Terrihalobacillus insolitus]MDC3412021.1 MFS transporter [Terrihalobacillus insolitus]MDC3423294.1 MFS transporter [Terrihalobacillus insolitus]
MFKNNLFQRFYYGWVIVFIAALGAFFSGPGQTYSNSIFVDEYINDFGWSRSEVSGLYSIATLIAGFTMIVVGRFIDRFGQRTMMVVVGVSLAAATFFNSVVSSMWMFVVGIFFIRLLGQGSMMLIPNTLVAQWFIKKRGRAVSFVSLGSFASAAAFPVINTWLIQTWDWQFAWRFWGVMLLVLFVPIALFGVRNRPEDIGLVPDGKADKNTKVSMGKMGKYIPETEENWRLNEAAKTRAFWMILICVGIPSMINTGITFHIISIFGSNQLQPEVAAMVLSLMAIVGIPMSFVSGFITEKIKTNYLLFLVFLIEIVLLLLLLIMSNYLIAIIVGILWGVANGLGRIATNVIWPNYFGRRHIGSINGVGVTMGVAGSAFGPLPFGIGFDIFQSYTPVLLLSLIFPLIGVTCSLLATKPVKAHADG